MSIEASLETVLECVAAESEIDSGEITIDEQTVKLTFKGDSVNNIRNKNVTLNLTVKFKGSVTFEELISLYSNPANVPIKATVQIDTATYYVEASVVVKAQTKEISGEITWLDSGNTNIRPTEVTVSLFANGGRGA